MPLPAMRKSRRKAHADCNGFGIINREGAGSGQPCGSVSSDTRSDGLQGESEVERTNGRKADEKRSVKITRHFTKYAEGSVLIEERRNAGSLHGLGDHGRSFLLRAGVEGWDGPPEVRTAAARDRNPYGP